MREVITKIYTYAELEGKAKEKAKEWFLNGEDHSDELLMIFIRELSDAGYPTCHINFNLNYCQGDGVAFYTGGPMPDFECIRTTPGLVWRTMGVEYAHQSCNLNRLWFRRLIRHFNKHERRRIYELFNEYIIPETIGFDLKITGRNGRCHHWNSMNIDAVIDFNGLDKPEYEGDDVIDWTDYRDIKGYLACLDAAIQVDVKEMSKHLEKIGYEYIEDRRSDAVVAEAMAANEYEFTKDGKIYP